MLSIVSGLGVKTMNSISRCCSKESCFVLILTVIHALSFGVIDGFVTACLNEWTPYNGWCYTFVHQNKTFVEAKTFCAGIQAQLVIIHLRDENEFLKRHLYYQKGDFSGSAVPHYWIGLTDADVEGTWRWDATDSIANFTDWYPGEPNNVNNGENCACFWDPFPNMQWNDFNCSIPGYFICEQRGLEFGAGSTLVG